MRNSRRQSGEWREEQQSDCAKCLRRLRGRLRILGNGPRAVRPPLAVGYSSGTDSEASLCCVRAIMDGSVWMAQTQKVQKVARAE
jgi:hypothetical protein